MITIALFKTKEQEVNKKHKGHIFTETERIIAKSKRDEKKEFTNKIKKKQEELILLDLELKKREKIKQIQEVENPIGNSSYDDYEEEEEEEEEQPINTDSPESLMTGLLTKALLSHQNKQKVVNSQSPQTQPSTSNVCSDVDIQKMVELLPDELIQKSKLVSDDTLSSIIAQKAPQLSPENRKYAVTLIRARK